MKNLHSELHIAELKAKKTTWRHHYTLSPNFLKCMVKENLLHEYPLINCGILTKSHTECCAHANTEYKTQPHCDKRIMSQKQILCSAVQHMQFAQRETNKVHYTARKARNS